MSVTTLAAPAKRLLAARDPRERSAQSPIFIDASCLLESKLTGIARFVARMIEALQPHAAIRLYTNGSGEDILLDGAELPLADIGIEAWAAQVMQQQRAPHDSGLAREGVGIYTVLRPPTKHFKQEIGILYDFTTLLLPWAHVAETRQHFWNFFSISALECDKLIAISESTKHDARWLTDLDEDQVVVGYPGPSMCVKRHTHVGNVQRKDNVVLVVSALEPRKNGPFLLDWFSRTEALPADMELWWVGPRAWWASNELMDDLARKQQGGKGDRIKFLGMVSDQQLCELYQQATFSIYPSLYEGFGFPVLDSLLHGAPVLTSYNSSLKEFDCPGVVYFDPGDPQSLDMAARELMVSLPARIPQDALRDKFSWDRLARTILSVCD